jgi:hypothetical protein
LSASSAGSAVPLDPRHRGVAQLAQHAGRRRRVGRRQRRLGAVAARRRRQQLFAQPGLGAVGDLTRRRRPYRGPVVSRLGVRCPCVNAQIGAATAGQLLARHAGSEKAKHRAEPAFHAGARRLGGLEALAGREIRMRRAPTALARQHPARIRQRRLRRHHRPALRQRVFQLDARDLARHLRALLEQLGPVRYAVHPQAALARQLHDRSCVFRRQLPAGA